jgi:fluoroquinolone resistance protein
MTTSELIQDHAKWRQGAGGAMAGVAGMSDAGSYTGLDLGLITISDTTFTGSGFTQVNFELAQISTSRFTGCQFTDCDFSQTSISACQFQTCSFTRCKFPRSSLSVTVFSRCVFDDVVFQQGHWKDIKLADCQGDKVNAKQLTGQGVSFLGTSFKTAFFEGCNLVP